MIKRVLGVSILALLGGAAFERAYADQVFVCDDGKAITVTDAGLADAIRYDPCVAKYYGKTALKRVVPLPIKSPLRRVVAARQSGEPRDRRRTVARPTAAAPRLTALPALAAPKLVAEGGGDVQTVTSEVGAASKARQRRVRRTKYTAMDERLSGLNAGTFRRVFVINGRRGGGAWYRHNE
ncbi:MAG: hypothetical protein AAFR01_03675 [Pseudomonadota bacterium]